ncbi:MAG: hypothetical protein RLZ83_904 [Pseudomonadota bacterium]|jgi:hypothetical protein
MTASASLQAADLLPQLVQVLHRFFYELDGRRYETAAGLFTDDGRWLRQGRWLEGRAAILDALHARPLDSETRHVMSNAFIAREEGDAAVVEAYMTAYRYPTAEAGGDLPTIAHPLRFNLVTTVFRRVAQSGWCIAEQRLVPAFGFTA